MRKPPSNGEPAAALTDDGLPSGPAGEIDPSAQRERACSGVFAKLAAKSTTKPSFDCERSPNFIATGSRSEGPSKSDRI